jgi:maltooligosyltrehalose trehalohydrolase
MPSKAFGKTSCYCFAVAGGGRIDHLCAPDRLRAAMALLLLAPSPPLLFMGEEFATSRPFLFFCDFGPELAAAVAQGRRRGFARFESFAELTEQQALPDPNAPETFARSKLDWDSLSDPPHSDWLDFYRSLLALRRDQIVPRLAGMQNGAAELGQLGEHGLRVEWRLADGSILTLLTNLSDSPLAISTAELPPGEPIYAYPSGLTFESTEGQLPSWSVVWHLRLPARSDRY